MEWPFLFSIRWRGEVADSRTRTAGRSTPRVGRRPRAAHLPAGWRQGTGHRTDLPRLSFTHIAELSNTESQTTSRMTRRTPDGVVSTWCCNCQEYRSGTRPRPKLFVWVLLAVVMPLIGSLLGSTRAARLHQLTGFRCGDGEMPLRPGCLAGICPAGSRIQEPRSRVGVGVNDHGRVPTS